MGKLPQTDSSIGEYIFSTGLNITYAMTYENLLELQWFLLNDNQTQTEYPLSDYVINCVRFPFKPALKLFDEDEWLYTEDYLNIGGYTLNTTGHFCKGRKLKQANFSGHIGDPFTFTLQIGTINLTRVFNSFVDYKCKYTIYLPYLKFIELPAEQIVGRTLSVNYQVNILTGECIAYINDETNPINIYTIYTTTGNIGYTINFNNSDLQARELSYIKETLNNTTSFLTGTLSIASGVSNQSSKEVVGGFGTLLGSITSQVNAEISRQHGSMSTGNLSQDVLNAISPTSMYVIIKKPIIKRGASGDTNYEKLIGRPCLRTLTLNTLTGFTKVESVHLENFTTATNQELEQIETLLKSGVIL